MQDLPDVTLCAIDCVNPVLALRALDISMAQCRFGRTLFLSDAADRYQLPGCEMLRIPRIASRQDYSRVVMKELGRYCATSHMLVIQWDGYVINGEAWRPDFLQYDYIGAPWGWYEDGHRVGNGGFSLRSRRLLEALQDSEIVELDPEDEAIGRRYRALLERRYGIRFAPEDLARAFSFENMAPNGRPFGFHGLFNMWMIIPPGQLSDFVSALAPGSVSGPPLLKLARNYLDLGRREEAAIVLRRRLEVLPGDAVARQLLRAAAQPATAPAAATDAGSRPGRNDPCPCGSGKRYKQCCGALGALGAPAAAAPLEGEKALLRSALDQHKAGRLDAAEALYGRVLQLRPDHAVARQYLGVLAMQRGDAAAGERMIREAIVALPGVPDFHNNLGLCLRRQDRHEEALEAYRQALALKPDYVTAYNNLGLDLQALGRVREAVAQFEHAIVLDPSYAEAHWNLGLALLVLGDLPRGWEEYDWRLKCGHFADGDLVVAGVAPWQGEPLAGKTLLVRQEQGAGDTIQFLRFIPELRRRGARVVLGVRPELAELARTVDSEVEILQESRSAEAFDYYVNLLSVARWLHVTLDSLPVQPSYLHPDPAKVAVWRARLGSHSGRRIGLVWGGNPANTNDRNRSCPLEALSPLLELPGTSWFSLQKGEPAQQLAAAAGRGIVDLGPDLPTYGDTAAALAALDLVISVDTSVAHLAGATGRPAWVLIPFAPDWRWLLEREDTPWYPSLRLFRQHTPGDWAGVIGRVGDALRS